MVYKVKNAFDVEGQCRCYHVLVPGSIHICTNVMAALIVKEFDYLPNCVPRISSCLPTIYDSLFATIFSSSLPRHSNKVIRQYAQVTKFIFLSFHHYSFISSILNDIL